MVFMEKSSEFNTRLNGLAWSSQIAILNWIIEVFSKKDRPRLANSFQILASRDLYFGLTVFGQYL